MQVTIEGVVSTDVCRRGERHTVEWTEHLRRLVRGGLVQVVEWHHPEAEFDKGGIQAKPVVKVSDTAARVLSPSETEAFESVAAKLPKRSRRRKAEDADTASDTDTEE